MSAWSASYADRDGGLDGAPGVVLTRDVPAFARGRGVGRTHVSMSHCDEYAVAVAHAEAVPGR